MTKKSPENIQAAARNNLMTNEEAAAMLGTTVSTLQAWRSTKRYNLKYVKIGKSVRYRLEDVQAFIESRTVSPVENG